MTFEQVDPADLTRIEIPGGGDWICGAPDHGPSRCGYCQLLDGTTVALLDNVAQDLMIVGVDRETNEIRFKLTELGQRAAAALVERMREEG